MSVSLWIEWPGERAEEIPIASLRQTDGFAEDAREMGLTLIPYFPSFFPIERENLDRLIREAQIFRDAMAARGAGYEEPAEVFNRLIDAFKRLKASEGWHASIG